MVKLKIGASNTKPVEHFAAMIPPNKGAKTPASRDAMHCSSVSGCTLFLQELFGFAGDACTTGDGHAHKGVNSDNRCHQLEVYIMLPTLLPTGHLPIHQCFMITLCICHPPRRLLMDSTYEPAGYLAIGIRMVFEKRKSRCKTAPVMAVKV